MACHEEEQCRRRETRVRKPPSRQARRPASPWPGSHTGGADSSPPWACTPSPAHSRPPRRPTRCPPVRHSQAGQIPDLTAGPACGSQSSPSGAPSPPGTALSGIATRTRRSCPPVRLSAAERRRVLAHRPAPHRLWKPRIPHCWQFCAESGSGGK